MKRLVFSIATAVAALGLGACEQRSSADLPEHYQQKGDHRKEAAPEHQDAPAHGQEKAPAAEHKG